MLRKASRPVTVEFAPPQGVPAAASAAVNTAVTASVVSNVYMPSETRHTVAVFAEIGKIGISFYSSTPNDPPVIKAVSSDGLAAKQPQLKEGLILFSVQGVPVSVSMRRPTSFRCLVDGCTVFNAV